MHQRPWTAPADALGASFTSVRKSENKTSVESEDPKRNSGPAIHNRCIEELDQRVSLDLFRHHEWSTVSAVGAPQQTIRFFVIDDELSLRVEIQRSSQTVGSIRQVRQPR